MTRMTIILPVLFLSAMMGAQNIHHLDAPAQEKKIYSGHLQLGGTSRDGHVIDFTNYYMAIDGVPEIPVMGEFHFSRYPNEQWEEQILKMKAGGLSVIPTYIFWSLHEEKEGKFDWSGNRNVRKFIKLCKKHGMDVIVRIGPFCHGEIRNGALPDWLLAKPVDLRSNDPKYLYYVERLYDQIAGQLKGLYFKDGGPIIGCQLENEHQSAAAPWAITYPGESVDYTAAMYDSNIIMNGVNVQSDTIAAADLGDIHMKTLKDLAVSKGIDVPFYTATGWGNAAVIGKEAVPVTAAYTYPFWEAPSMSPFCLFKDIHHFPDYAPVRYDTDQFPSFCAEMGVGIQMIYKRRPIVTAEASEALVVRTLGSGSNGIGYYMYQGGSTPRMQDGVGFFSDQPMGVPKISYDFQAPLGEFGLEHPSYRPLRVIHAFLSDFGDRLAPMETVLPEGYEKITPDNRDDLRYAVRMKDGSGFIFMVNFQDHDLERHDMEDIRFQLGLKNEKLTIPSEGGFTLPKDASLILPFNFQMQDALLKYSTAQLMMKIDDRGNDHYIFFALDGIEPEYLFDGATVRGEHEFHPETGLESTINVKTKAGKTICITTLTRAQALNCCKLNGKILITDATVLPYKKKATLLNLGNPEFSYVLYPSAQGFKELNVSVKPAHQEAKVERTAKRRFSVSMRPETYPQVQEFFLKVDYTGDVAMAFMNGELQLDHFWHGQPWTIGLKRFHNLFEEGHSMNFYIRPIHRQVPYLHDIPTGQLPDFSKGKVVDIQSVNLIPEYKIDIQL